MSRCWILHCNCPCPTLSHSTLPYIHYTTFNVVSQISPVQKMTAWRIRIWNKRFIRATYKNCHTCDKYVRILWRIRTRLSHSMTNAFEFFPRLTNTNWYVQQSYFRRVWTSWLNPALRPVACHYLGSEQLRGSPMPLFVGIWHKQGFLMTWLNYKRIIQ